MTPVQIVSNLLDALAEFRGTTITAEQKLQIVRQFLNYHDTGEGSLTNDEIAENFLEQLTHHIVRVGRTQIKHHRNARMKAEEEAEVYGAEVNVLVEQPVEVPAIPEEEENPV